MVTAVLVDFEDLQVTCDANYVVVRAVCDRLFL